MEVLNEENTQLLQSYIDTRELKQNTINNYKFVFTKIQNALTNHNIKDNTIKYLVKDLNKSNLPKTTINKFYSIYKNMITDKDKALLDLETIKNKKVIDIDTKERTKTQTKETIVSYQDLVSLLKKLNGMDYMLLYLLTEYGVRNMDLIIDYTNDKNVINGVEKGNIEKNIMYFKGNKLFYTRNDYKTKDKYGVLTYEIKDKKFKSIMKELEVDNFVFEDRNGNPYDTSTIGNLIKRTFNKFIQGSNLSESKIYKLMVDNHNVLEDQDRIIELAQSRGHDLSTQDKYYSNDD